LSLSLSLSRDEQHSEKDENLDHGGLPTPSAC
jgi:hypothetical protein